MGCRAGGWTALRRGKIGFGEDDALTLTRAARQPKQEELLLMEDVDDDFDDDLSAHASQPATVSAQREKQTPSPPGVSADA